jgi:hypothetical protein
MEWWYAMNVKVILGHYTTYDLSNMLQVKTVERVINTTAAELCAGKTEVNIDIQRFWAAYNNTQKFVDYYEAPDVFQPELLSEIYDK